MVAGSYLFVLDSSVLIKWFRQEEVLGEQALKLRKTYLEGNILILVPFLAVYELSNVLRYKVDLTIEQVQEAVQSLFDIGLDWVPPEAEVLRRAVEIARIHDITVYDSVFVALAENQGAIFITADQRLARKLENLPFAHFLGGNDVHQMYLHE